MVKLRKRELHAEGSGGPARRCSCLSALCPRFWEGTVCSDPPGTTGFAQMNSLNHTCRAINGKSDTRSASEAITWGKRRGRPGRGGDGTYPEGRLSGLAVLPGSTLPPGCRNLAASKAELLPEAEAAASRSQVPAPSAAPSGGTQPLRSEGAGASGPGACSPVDPGQVEAQAPSSGTRACSGAGASSCGALAGEDDSPLAAKATNRTCDSDDKAEPSTHSGASGTDKNKTGQTPSSVAHILEINVNNKDLRKKVLIYKKP